ncbi:hypothetical protein [Streptomyces pseudovenezuelae]|nr:hypothetical protein [Streptomyces pseudovenezuelae]
MAGTAGALALERDRARFGLIAVVFSNLAIVGVALFGVWRLDGDKAVMVGVLASAFTAVSSMTTAYLGIKAVSNTAQSFAMGDGEPRNQSAPGASPPADAVLPAPVPPSATPPEQRVP